MFKDPIAFDLDVACICIAVETSRDCIDVQIPPGVAMLVKHEVAYVPHVHEVFTGSA